MDAFKVYVDVFIGVKGILFMILLSQNIVSATCALPFNITSDPWQIERSYPVLIIGIESVLIDTINVEESEQEFNEVKYWIK